MLISLPARGTLMNPNKPLNVDALGELAKDNARSGNQMEVKEVEVSNNPV